MDPFPQSAVLFDDVRRRTNNSIMFYKGEPVLVRYVREINVAIYPIETYYSRGLNHETPMIPYTDPNLVSRIPTLGYINPPGNRARFVTRNVVRTQREGLPTDQLIVGGTYMSIDLIFTQAFKDMLLNKYPTIQEAWAEAQSTYTRAFSKSYAISKDLNIFHRERLIGRLQPSDRYLAGYEINYHSSISRVSFYRKNFEDRFNKQLMEFTTK